MDSRKMDTSNMKFDNIGNVGTLLRSPIPGASMTQPLFATVSGDNISAYATCTHSDSLSSKRDRFPGFKDDTKTKLFVEFGNVKCAYKYGDNILHTGAIIPNVKKIDVLGDRVIRVLFVDGSVEKAILNGNDTYCYEYGVTICLMKRILSKMTGGYGNALYNKLVAHAIKQNEITERSIKAENELKEKVKADAKKQAEKAKAARINAANKKKEREIEIQTEAYFRAMRKFSDEQMNIFGDVCPINVPDEATDVLGEKSSEDNSDN